jgi:anti-sigma B factor antagonist
MNKQGSMVVKNPSEEIKEIFEVTGFSDILTIE